MGQALVALVLMVVTNAAAVVDVYRMIHYDLGETPMGSRRAMPCSTIMRPRGWTLRAPISPGSSSSCLCSKSTSHRSTSLCRTRVSLVVYSCCFCSKSNGGEGDDSDENVRRALAELEQWLVHNTFQNILHEVSANDATGRPATATTERICLQAGGISVRCKDDCNANTYQHPSISLR